MKASEYVETLRPEVLALALAVRQTNLALHASYRGQPTPAVQELISEMRRDVLNSISRTKAAERRIRHRIANGGDWEWGYRSCE